MQRKSKSKEMLEHYSKEQLKDQIIFNSRNTLAHQLAQSGEWHTNDIEILMLKNDSDESVAQILAEHNKNWLTYKRKILKIYQKNYISVAHCLAMYNSNWYTYDKEILLLTMYERVTVAEKLVQHNPAWCCYYVPILNMTYVKRELLGYRKYFASRVKKNAITIIPII